MTFKRPFDRHIPFYIAAATGIAAFCVSLAFSVPLASTFGATVFFVVYIALVLRDMPLFTADYLRRNARKTDLPVQIISETGKWRLVCDPEGNVAWIWGSLLTNPRTVLSPSGSRIELRHRPSRDAPVNAVMRPKALATVEKCSKGWCKVSVGGQKGWAPEDAFWGRQKTPVCQRPDPLGVR